MKKSNQTLTPLTIAVLGFVLLIFLIWFTPLLFLSAARLWNTFGVEIGSQGSSTSFEIQLNTLYVLFTGILCVPVFLIYQQMRIMKLNSDREELYRQEQIFKRITDPDLTAAKKIFFNFETAEMLKNIDNSKADKKRFQIDMDNFRKKFDEACRKIEAPLLPRSDIISLDLLEALLNQYIYISKLYLSGDVMEINATQVGLENMKNNFDRLYPFICFRRIAQEKYALEYEEAVKRMKN